MTEFQAVQFVWNATWAVFVVFVVVVTGPSTFREVRDIWRHWRSR